MDGRLVGASVARLEDAALLRGQASFVDDLTLPGLLEAAFVRSSFAHAEIGGIDASAALAHPGVHAVLTLDDLKPHLQNEELVVGLPSPSYRQNRNRPALARGETVYVGEPIAAVIANSRYTAEDAAAMVSIDYRPLPAVSNCRRALEDGAPIAHSDAEHNLLAEFDMAYGDVDAAFADAAHVFSDAFWVHRGGSHSIECRGCVASHDPVRDVVTLWSSTQMPHSLRNVLVDMTGRDEDRFHVMSPEIGGGFGPKLVVYQEDVTLVIASMILGSPIKWIEDRREHFIATTQERDQYWDAEIAVDAEGRILGVRGGLIHDHGAYTARGVNLAYNAAETVPLGYEVPAYHMNIRLALTNKVPVTPVRGAGHPQSTFVMERLLDRVARELGLDRADVRRRNLIPTESMPCTLPLKTRGDLPVVLDSGDYAACQTAALARAGWDGFPSRQAAARAAGRHIGIGMANFVKGTGRGPFEIATVRIGSSGHVHVHTGGTAIGQGTHTMCAQIAADLLGGDMSNIRVITGDTKATPLGLGAANSRLAVTAGSSVHVAATKVRQKALKVAAHLMEAAEEDLEIDGAEIRVRGVPDMKLGLKDVARAVAGTPGYTLPGGTAPGMEATETVVLDDMAYSSGTAVAEVEVDIETGSVRLVNYVIAHDSGVVINPMTVAGQVLGGAAHGIGDALFCWMGYDDEAQPVTTTLAEYLLVPATEIPPVEIIDAGAPTPQNPLGVKGVGECGGVPAPAAIISAVEDALSPFGARLTHAPVTPAEIVSLIEGA